MMVLGVSCSRVNPLTIPTSPITAHLVVLSHTEEKGVIKGGGVVVGVREGRGREGEGERGYI